MQAYDSRTFAACAELVSPVRMPPETVSGGLSPAIGTVTQNQYTYLPEGTCHTGSSPAGHNSTGAFFGGTLMGAAPTPDLQMGRKYALFGEPAVAGVLSPAVAVLSGAAANKPAADCPRGNDRSAPQAVATRVAAQRR